MTDSLPQRGHSAVPPSMASGLSKSAASRPVHATISVGGKSCTQQKQPPKGPVGDSLLVVSATPDTLDSLDFMDEFRQDERDNQTDESAAEPGERGAGADGQAEPGKNKRKRRRKSQRPDHE